MSPRSKPRPRTDPAARLARRIEKRSAHLAVIGLGYVGLPLAVEFGEAGFHVSGIDLNEARVRRLQHGRSYIQDVPTAAVRHLTRAGRLSATSDFSVLRHVDAVNVCVPTPLSKHRDPDVSHVVAAAEQVAKYLHPGMLVVLESTTYPGTTDELILPLLEKTGMKVVATSFSLSRPSASIPGIPSSTPGTFPRWWAE